MGVMMSTYCHTLLHKTTRSYQSFGIAAALYTKLSKGRDSWEYEGRGMPNDFGGGSRFACVSEGFQLCRGRTIPIFYGLILMEFGWIFVVVIDLSQQKL